MAVLFVGNFQNVMVLFSNDASYNNEHKDTKCHLCFKVLCWALCSKKFLFGYMSTQWVSVMCASLVVCNKYGVDMMMECYG